MRCNTTICYNLAKLTSANPSLLHPHLIHQPQTFAMILGTASSFTLILLIVATSYFYPLGMNSPLRFSDIEGMASTHELIGTHTSPVLL
ncbi:hypothetical protein HETIRDRAFT_421251 [Heterobasidion irregulare TC 32-1]|uniref:Uncharacterized protein n=1 Tax=Heterobasidion irregulare (strain TC 32-1) TaxID=747525 RepID=W4JUB7_HETIT|nr:uncharacterized protein HETIRDRAFT_421251 [Heterobasidion irregulare TC 32-1]ETW77059.1 hypothetical protein HETIRDRAFT_421251 [Heterobasidion irregulare TC 32-1]